MGCGTEQQSRMTDCHIVSEAANSATANIKPQVSTMWTLVLLDSSLALVTNRPAETWPRYSKLPASLATPRPRWGPGLPDLMYQVCFCALVCL